MNDLLLAVPDDAVWPTGFTMRPREQRVDRAMIDAFRNIPTAHISDCLGRHQGAIGLRDYHDALKNGGFCGTAVTVRARPGDNLMVHAALLLAQPGDIIVVDGSGDVSTAVIGGLMRTTAITKKVGGIVIDGAIRDTEEWAQGEMPIYAKGHTHRGPSKEGPGELNVPIACAGMAVLPGDLIVGDADGVVVVPASQAASLLEKCHALAAREDAVRAQNRSGQPDLKRFVDILKNKGCPL